MSIDAPCIICGRRGPSHGAHWPIAAGMGGRSPKEDAKLPRVPMCFGCHIGGEHTTASPEVVEILIARAPDYWRRTGRWDEYREIFERWVDLYRFKQRQRQATPQPT